VERKKREGSEVSGRRHTATALLTQMGGSRVRALQIRRVRSKADELLPKIPGILRSIGRSFKFLILGQIWEGGHSP
jgi:hypothetical protein